VEAQPDEDWIHIFQRFFEMFEIDPAIVDALVDWLDGDDSPSGPGGAESSYYAGLTPPYIAADGPMHTPGELRLVMGFNAETIAKLFPGITLEAVADADMGSNSYLTPYGVDPNESGANPNATAKVNLNTAIPEVLQALLEGLQEGGNADTAIEEILAYRSNEQQFKSLDEVCQLLTDCRNLNKVADVKSAYFRIESIGRLGPIQKKAVAVIQRSQEATSLLYFKIE
jgi:general secretion pathway protein K